MLSYSARSAAPPAEAWALIARPARWHEWAPHIRGAWGLGSPEVRVGARGAARLFGALPVPAAVTAKRPGSSWTWRVGPVELVHRVEPRSSGCEIAIDLVAPGPVEAALRATYGPVVALLVRRLARVAER
jgi:hypothetical protein